MENHTRNDEKKKKKNYYLWMEIEFSYGERISVLKFYPIVILFWVEENGGRKKKRKKRIEAQTRVRNYEIFRGISCNSSVNVTSNLSHTNAILELTVIKIRKKKKEKRSEINSRYINFKSNAFLEIIFSIRAYISWSILSKIKRVELNNSNVIWYDQRCVSIRFRYE